MGQISYMRDPDLEHSFEVGDTVEVYCDHEKDKDRTRGWLKGIIVQIDNKMVAVQFRSNVFLTDGAGSHLVVSSKFTTYPLDARQEIQEKRKRDSGLLEHRNGS